ncbi:hypothetical protein B4N89_42090 [Embleya scabrispora]|uniref:Uncharacterized protein n=1 Tax=Embleya scabrispora TaxID=159449 RepID=A0A1T3NJY4_9ACTN|nr:hypothetical protein B4N89_42090 [Embleya scabrispora]
MGRRRFRPRRRGQGRGAARSPRETSEARRSPRAPDDHGPARDANPGPAGARALPVETDRGLVRFRS